MRCRWRRWRNHWASIKWERPVAGTPSTGLILIFILSSSNSNNSNHHRAKPRPRTHVTHTATHIHTATVTVIRTSTNHPHRGRDGALQASSWVKVSCFQMIPYARYEYPHEFKRTKIIFFFFFIRSWNCPHTRNRNVSCAIFISKTINFDEIFDERNRTLIIR